MVSGYFKLVTTGLKKIFQQNLIFSILQMQLGVAKSQAVRFVTLSLIVQAFLGLALFAGLSQNINPFVLCIVFLLFNMEHQSWIDHNSNTSLFHHLAMQKNAFNIYCFCKIMISSALFMVFLYVNLGAWTIAGLIHVDFMVSLIAVTPYFVGMQAIIVSLNKGHIRGTYIAPIMMLPLQIPIFFLLISSYHMPIYILATVSLLLVSSLSLLMRVAIETVID
jgi:hypothetical protein